MNQSQNSMSASACLNIKPVLMCRRCICDMAAGTTCDTSQTNDNMCRQQLEPLQSSTASTPAKLNLSQLCRHAGDKDCWDEQCCRPLWFSYQNSFPGSTGGLVAGASAADENQALLPVQLLVDVI